MRDTCLRGRVTEKAVDLCLASMPNGYHSPYGANNGEIRVTFAHEWGGGILGIEDTGRFERPTPLVGDAVIVAGLKGVLK